MKWLTNGLRIHLLLNGLKLKYLQKLYTVDDIIIRSESKSTWVLYLPKNTNISKGSDIKPVTAKLEEIFYKF